jgi:Lsr2
MRDGGGNTFAAGEGGIQVAQKISVTFACDYDSREIPDGEHMTRAFSLDGRDYEIDLCEKHSQKFDEVLQRFADKARKVTGRVGKPKRRTTAHRQRSADIRSWAKRSGMEVSDRGRIPADVIAKYEANH